MVGEGRLFVGEGALHEVAHGRWRIHRPTADGHVGVVIAVNIGHARIADRFATVGDGNHQGGQVLGGVLAQIVAVIIGGTTHQQHIARGGVSPCFGRVAQKVGDGLWGGVASAKMVVNFGHIHHTSNQPLGAPRLGQGFHGRQQPLRGDDEKIGLVVGGR